MDPLPPFAVGSATSLKAAKAMRPKRRKQALVILDLYQTTWSAAFLNAAPPPFDGLTSDEVEVALRLPHQSVSARINELTAAGCLVETSFRRTTRAGAEASVYALASDASEAKFDRWLLQHREALSRKRAYDLWQERLRQAAVNYATSSTPQYLSELANVARQAPR